MCTFPMPTYQTLSLILCHTCNTVSKSEKAGHRRARIIWPGRKGQRIYYYRKERSGMSVRSVYVSLGGIAALAATLDEGQRNDQEGKRLKEQRQRDAFKSSDSCIDSAG